MNELLQSIKADLLSRQMLVLLAVAATALVGALAYAVLGTGAGSSQPPAAAPATPLAKGMVAQVAPPNPASAASETPAGVQYQTQGATRNPFKPVPGTPLAAAASTNSSKPGGSGSGASSSSAGGSSSSKSSGGPGNSTGGSSGSGKTTGSGGSTTPATKPTTPPKPAPKLKLETLAFYSVSAMFGLAPANPGEPAALTPYEEMKRYEPLPSAKEPLVAFVGVDDKGKPERAVFEFVKAPILRGEGSCLPSETHCEAIALAAGKSEELEYFKPNGQTVDYELKVVKISKRALPAGAARSAKALSVSKAGLHALHAAGLSAIF